MTTAWRYIIWVSTEDVLLVRLLPRSVPGVHPDVRIDGYHRPLVGRPAGWPTGLTRPGALTIPPDKFKPAVGEGEGVLIVVPEAPTRTRDQH